LGDGSSLFSVHDTGKSKHALPESATGFIRRGNENWAEIGRLPINRRAAEAWLVSALESRHADEKAIVCWQDIMERDGYG
jgi:hypothetical protein